MELLEQFQMRDATTSNPADLLMKPLPQILLTTHSSSLGLFPDPGVERGC